MNKFEIAKGDCAFDNNDEWWKSDEQQPAKHSTTQLEEFTSFIAERLDAVGKLFGEKQNQYSTSADPLANFRTGALLEYGVAEYKEMYEVAKGYLNKHIAFIYDHGIVPKTDESLNDMVVYGLIMLYLVKKHKEVGKHEQQA